VTVASPQVAIVDDEEPVRRGLERLLRSWGFGAEGFASGELFLASLGTRRPDCIILDLHMPGMDGFAVLDRLAATRPRIPVVIITGYDTTETRERAERSGIGAYLRKPLDGQALADAVHASIARG
jgi:FixJ family two-component response regulator